MLTPNTELQWLADRYCRTNLARANGVPGIVATGHYVRPFPCRAKAIAAEYNRLPVCDDRPLTVRSYRALETELYDQFRFIEKEGNYRLIPWIADGEPYANSAEMRADVRQHRRLYFFTGGELHPVMRHAQLRTLDGRHWLTGNDCFRAVHDVFGHCAEGYGFGARGEENAWLHHSMMFSRLAQLALTTETRGQNSWVNFGPFSHLPVCERPYAIQKAALLPSRFADWQTALVEK